MTTEERIKTARFRNSYGDYLECLAMAQVSSFPSDDPIQLTNRIICSRSTCTEYIAVIEDCRDDGVQVHVWDDWYAVESDIERMWIIFNEKLNIIYWFSI